MIQEFLERQLASLEKNKKLIHLTPLLQAINTFFYEPAISTKGPPHIRDAVDLKRWMVLVLVALIPCFFMAVWNTGMQHIIYTSSDPNIMNQFFSIHSMTEYISFTFENHRYLSILYAGFVIFAPILILSYITGIFWEGLFAAVRGTEISEGFLVTGALVALILPPTIPYWMIIVGVSVGVILSKEVFGGTGMNLLNPALTTRAFLFFSYPTQLSGSVWIAGNPTIIKASLDRVNEYLSKSIDGYSAASPLSIFNISSEVKQFHINALSSYLQLSPISPIVEKQFMKWQSIVQITSRFTELTLEQIQNFLTAPILQGGLGLSHENFSSAYQFVMLKYNQGIFTDGNFFLGNQIGSLGETSVLACLLGAIFLLVVGVASWRIILSMIASAFITACVFQWASLHFGGFAGAVTAAKYNFPAYKHLLLGGFAFATIFMATDPVSAPGMNTAKWMYGSLIGFVMMIIRILNPAFPEGVMLSIIFANIFAPLFDRFSLIMYRKIRYARAEKISR